QILSRCTHVVRNTVFEGVAAELAYPLRVRKRLRLDGPAGAVARGGQAAHQSDRPVPRRGQLPELLLGGVGPVHRQRSRARTDRSGASTTGADACGSHGRDARDADRITMSVA